MIPFLNARVFNAEAQRRRDAELFNETALRAFGGFRLRGEEFLSGSSNQRKGAKAQRRNITIKSHRRGPDPNRLLAGGTPAPTMARRPFIELRRSRCTAGVACRGIGMARRKPAFGGAIRFEGPKSVSIRTHPCPIQNHIVQATNRATTKSDTAPATNTTQKKKSVQICVHPCPILCDVSAPSGCALRATP